MGNVRKAKRKMLQNLKREYVKRHPGSKLLVRNNRIFDLKAKVELKTTESQSEEKQA